MVKIRCFKIEKCPICSKDRSLQVFFNKQNKIKYARTRHYSHSDRDSKKPQFTYCKLEDLNQLETLLHSLNFQFPTEAGINLGQALIQEYPGQTSNCVKIGHKDLASVQQFKRAGSSVRIEHHPPKVGVVGSNPTPPATTRLPTIFKKQLQPN
jgi:hypothetical protein